MTLLALTLVGRHRHRRRDRRAREHLPVHRGEGHGRRCRRRSRRREEIGLAVLATTLSLVAMFLPVGFMGGIVGRFLKSFGLTMAFAILVSLLVSFTLTPMLAARWLQDAPRRRDGEPPAHASQRLAVLPRRSIAATRACSTGRWRTAASWPAIARAGAALERAAVHDREQELPAERRPVASSRSACARPKARACEATELHRQPHRARDPAALPEVDYTLVTVGGRSGADAERRQRSTSG